MDSNSTALHKISVVVDEIDAGANATVDFMEQYGWYVLISVLGCFALCIIERHTATVRALHCCCDLFWCLSCGCCGTKSRHHRLRDDEI